MENNGKAINFGRGQKKKCIVINIDKFSYFRSDSIGMI